MTTNILRFATLPERERRRAGRSPLVSEGDRVEVRVRSSDGTEIATPLPPVAAEVVALVLDRLFRGERIAVLSEEQELSPNEAAAILGTSRPLVVHRMEVGDLPFRYVGKHRRATLSAVIALKQRLDVQREALAALVSDAEELTAAHGL